MLLTKREVAARLRVHVATVERMIKDGRLQAIKSGKPGSRGHVRISEDALNDYLRGSAVEASV